MSAAFEGHSKVIAPKAVPGCCAGMIPGMLRIVESVSAAAAKRYFNECLQPGDYYVGEHAEVGRWGGAGAKELGLVGPVRKEQFEHLCDNELPDGSGRLTVRTKLGRRVGYDFNVHCPKSMSVLYAFTKDERLREAFDRAGDETMEQIEAAARTRVRVGGQQAERPSPNLLWAAFYHDTTRPVDGVPDPHIHTHYYVFNATLDPVEHRWKAIDVADVKRRGAFFEASFHSRLTELVTAAGYEVERRGQFWELKCVPESVIEKYSRRSDEINQYADEHGITDPKEKAELGAKTRRSKSETRPWNEVVQNWEERLTADERKALMAAKDAPSPAPSALSRAAAAKEAVDYAISVSLERASVVSEDVVLEHAMRHSFGRANLQELRAQLNRPELVRREVDGVSQLTTAEVLREEQELLAFARDGRGTCSPFTQSIPPTDGLTPSQGRALEHILGSRDRVTLVRGPAGTGKTRLMTTAVPALEAAGHHVTVVAPTTDAARGTLRKEGFEKADTLARFLCDEKFSESARDGVLWVDEAGLVGTRSMGELFKRTDALGARVILMGDYRQHAAVERGDTLRLLEKQSGLRSAEIREIRRQHGAYREAMEALSQGDTEEGFRKLDALGAIEEHPDAEGRYAAVTAEYLAARQANKSVLVVCPTHKEGGRVTDGIRNALREDGKLGEQRQFDRLRNLHLTEPERTNPLSYSPGQVVQFHRSAAGFPSGARVNVASVDVESQSVGVESGGLRTPLPLDMAARFDVFERGKIDIAPGDTIRVTRNGRTADGDSAISNGTRHKVAGFDRFGDIVLNDGRVLSKSFAHFDHGYCTTSYGAQGATVERVLVVQSAESYRASSQAQFYVSTSRGVDSVRVFTDNKEDLFNAVQKDSARLTATELVKPEVAGLWLARASEQVMQVPQQVLDAGLQR